MTEQKGTFGEIHPQESSDEGSSPAPSSASHPYRSDGIPGAVSGSSGGGQSSAGWGKHPVASRISAYIAHADRAVFAVLSWIVGWLARADGNVSYA